MICASGMPMRSTASDALTATYAHYKGAAKLGHGTGYKYAHDYKNHYVKQQYLPYELTGKKYYEPSWNGYEAKIREHMKRIREEADGDA